MVRHLDNRRTRLQRTGLVVAVSTSMLTASFVGLVALVSGNVGGLGGRLPYYVLAMAAAFVVAIFLLDERRVDGVAIILGTTGISLLTFVFVLLSVEGIVYALEHPDAVIASQLLVYFLAAGLIGSGLGYWGLRHWREFAA